jgi:hypothetical protein
LIKKAGGNANSTFLQLVDRRNTGCPRKIYQWKASFKGQRILSVNNWEEATLAFTKSYTTILF